MLGIVGHILIVIDFVFRLLEESYLNQYTDSDVSSEAGEGNQDVEDVEEQLDACDINEAEQIFDDELYCVACNKFFVNESSKINHEASKKHKQNMEILRSEMKSEEENYQLQHNIQLGTEDEAEQQDSEPDSIGSEKIKKPKGKKSKKKNKNPVNISHDDIDSENELDSTPLVDVTPEEKDDDSDKSWSNNKKGKKTKSKIKSKSEKPAKEEPVVEVEVIATEETEHLTIQRCATCKEVFVSKNKLFAHLKKTNHSIFLGDDSSKVTDKTSSKKKKK